MAALNPSIVTGFGVEIELNFAFHEDRLVEVLTQRGLSRDHVVKAVPIAVRKAIGLRHYGHPPLYLNTRPHHRGWVLRIDSQESLQDWKGEDGKGAGVVHPYRTYWSEPLSIVQGVLAPRGHAIDVDASTSLHVENSYKKWKVVNDHSLVSAGKAELKEALADRISNKELTNWDNTGLELVTPIMRHAEEGDGGFRTIQLYLDTLRGDERSTFGVFPSKYGSVHVHVGFAESDKTLLVLQHLAFILLRFEPLLTRLFPLHRNGSHVKNMSRGLCKEDARSNQDKAYMYVRHQNLSALTVAGINELGDKIFATTTVAELCKMMQYNPSNPDADHDTKGHLVNWINMFESEKGTPGSKRTVEFRHHESTVDALAIKMWVRLLLRICRSAESIATKTSVAPDKERHKHQERPQQLDHVHTMVELFELVGLGNRVSLYDWDFKLRTYWGNRYQRYHDDQDGLEPTPEAS